MWKAKAMGLRKTKNLKTDKAIALQIIKVFQREISRRVSAVTEGEG